jgi:hypothetical protein
MEEIDKDRIKAIIAAAKKIYGPAAPGLAPPRRWKSLTDERNVAKLLTPALEKAGLGTRAISKSGRRYSQRFSRRLNGGCRLLPNCASNRADKCV